MGVDLGPLRSRSQNYGLLAQLVATGFDEHLLPILRLSPQYAPSLQGRDVQELATIHERTFGFDLSPFAGAYLDPRGRVGGPLRGRLEQNLVAIGAQPGHPTAEPESLSEQLALLSRLVGGEVEGWENERPEEWQGFQLAQGLVLHQHLLPWLPPVTVALGLQSEAPYQVLGQALWDCAHHHVQELDARCTGYQMPMVSGPDGGALLADPSTGLAQIAEFLVRPFDSGWYLSRSDLAGIAESNGCSLAPGPRRQMMEDLLHLLDVASLIGALSQRVDRWRVGYEALHAPEQVQPWIERLDQAHRVVAGLRAAV